MTKTVFAIFDNRSDAEAVIEQLQTEGFDPEDISIVMKDSREAEDMRENTGANVASDAVSGATTGAVIGGIAGLLAGTVLPGLGALLIGGPIAAALGLSGAAATTVSGAATGAAAGGLLGALTGLGLSREEAEHYQTQVKEGAILLAVPVINDRQASTVADLFDEYDASDVKTVTQKERSQDTRDEYADIGEEDMEITRTSTYQFATEGMKGGKAGHHEKAHKGKKSHRSKK